MRGWTVSAAAGAFALALVSGCSPVTGLNDAGGDDDDDGDGGQVIDASTDPDAAWVRGTVTVEVRRPGGGPAFGVRVLFNEPDGSVASSQTTNVAGRASFDLFPHSSITILTSETFDASFQRHNINTVLGVMPNDFIVIGSRDDGADSGTYMGDLRVDIRTAFPSAGQYELRVGCEGFGANTGTNDLQLFQSSCNGGLTPVDAIATARDSESTPLAFQTLLGVTLSSATYTQINSWRTDWARLTLRLTNSPDDMQFATAEMPVWRRGLDYSLGEGPGVNLTPDGTTPIDILFPPGFAERIAPQLLAFWGSFPDDIDGLSTYQRQSAASGTELTIDLSSDLLPRVTSADFAQNGFDGARMSWDVDGDVSGASAGAGSVQWTQIKPGIGGNPDTEITWEWFFIFAPDLESPAELPNIPAGSLADGAWPPPTEAAINSSVVGFVDATFAGDWDDIRQNDGFELLDNPVDADTPTGSEVRLTIGGLIGFN